jgi:hypothetical protein
MNAKMKCHIRTLVGRNVSVAQGSENYVDRVLGTPIDLDDYLKLEKYIRSIDVTPRFKDVIDTFHVQPGVTPAGFRVETDLEADGLLKIDLLRDISRSENGEKRPTRFIYSADSANPYEIAPIKGLIGNLTCNPGIIYNLFLKNSDANVGNKFKNRTEVMAEIGRILGPGCDISVELNNPFADINEIMEEVEEFKELLSEYRVVIKVPHTGPINSETVKELMCGDRTFSKRYDEGKTEDFLRGHNIALRLKEEGYRVNFTLMFEPYQTALALQAKPYFINSFVRHRLKQSDYLKGLLKAYESGGNRVFLEQIRDFLVANDYLAPSQKDHDLLEVLGTVKDLLAYRCFNGCNGADGLDMVRHNLRMLKHCNLPDTRLIICSMEGPHNYPDIDRLMLEDEFAGMTDRVVITATPRYLARFTSTNQVITYQRRFMNAVGSYNEKS